MNPSWNLKVTVPGKKELSEEEKNRVWGRGAVSLKPGVLCLQHWSPDFDFFEQKSTTTQIWVRFYKLPWEYWHHLILTDIAKGIGTPLRIDNNTLNGAFECWLKLTF